MDTKGFLKEVPEETLELLHRSNTQDYDDDMISSLVCEAMNDHSTRFFRSNWMFSNTIRLTYFVLDQSLRCVEESSLSIELDFLD